VLTTWETACCCFTLSHSLQKQQEFIMRPKIIGIYNKTQKHKEFIMKIQSFLYVLICIGMNRIESTMAWAQMIACALGTCTALGLTTVGCYHLFRMPLCVSARRFGSTQSDYGLLGGDDFDQVLFATCFKHHSISEPLLHVFPQTRNNIRRMGQGMICDHTTNERSDIYFHFGCKMITFKWILSGRPFLYAIAVDFGNRIQDVEDMLSLYYHTRIQIHTPSGTRANRSWHVVTAAKLWNTTEFDISGYTVSRWEAPIANTGW
jgi:hypothetical protein